MRMCLLRTLVLQVSRLATLPLWLQKLTSSFGRLLSAPIGNLSVAPSALSGQTRWVRSVILAFLFLVAFEWWASAASPSMRVVTDETGIGLSVKLNGSFEVTSQIPAWQFGGSVGSPVSNLASRRGRDLAGDYREIEFKYQPTKSATRLGAIRVYDHRPVVVFRLKFLTPGKITESFPSISSYPRKLHHLSYTSTFGGFSFEKFGPDGPWVFFDDQANTFIFSPASHYMNAALSFGPHHELVSGLSVDNGEIPSGFTVMSALVIAPGINRAFEIWGRFLTDLAGKKRPANDADFPLKYFGYWTDHGAQYYYRFERSLGYVGTLLKVRDQLRTMNIPLGYVQIDSWFYQKGHEGKWQSEDPLGGGTFVYEASKELFPEGLKAFRKRLGVPLVAHNRWIDERSPYRTRYAMSGNVTTDPRLWVRWMSYLHATGVRAYEQDWLSGPALPERDLSSGEQFMDAMAQAARQAGITLQYCMPLPRHFLQGTRYSNLMTIRVSGDRFDQQNWPSFLFNGRLASALGEWPWTDVFMSSETSNLLLSTLSASLVGIGDAVGQFDRTNLLQVIRSDGVIVKPDDSIAPLDSTYIAEANNRGAAVVAATRTRHEGVTTSYVFAFRQTAEQRTASFLPSALGYTGPVYAYDYFDKRGKYVEPGEAIEFVVPDNGAYWIIVPIGASGVGFLGDATKFVSNGRNRVARIFDNGALEARMIFSAGETRMHLYGFSRVQPVIQATRAAVKKLVYDSHTQLFQFDLVSKPGTTPTVIVRVTSCLSGRVGLVSARAANAAGRRNPSAFCNDCPMQSRRCGKHVSWQR